MKSAVEVAGALVRVEIHWEKRPSDYTKSMSFPISHNFSFVLLMRDELNIYFQLSVYSAVLV